MILKFILTNCGGNGLDSFGSGQEHVVVFQDHSTLQRDLVWWGTFVEGLDRNVLRVCLQCLVMCKSTKKLETVWKLKFIIHFPTYYFSPSSSTAIESVFAKLNVVSSCFCLFFCYLPIKITRDVKQVLDLYINSSFHRSRQRLMEWSFSAALTACLWHLQYKRPITDLSHWLSV